MSASSDIRSATINLRLHEEARELIDRAASAVGKSRTEFMVEAARREAVHVLLDHRYFVLDEAQSAAFQRALDESPTDNPRLRRLLKIPLPWQK